MSFFRPDVERIAGYIPGEQPQESGWVKLNTNENPYPPSERIVSALVEEARGRMQLYPDPLATKLRTAVAGLFNLEPDQVLPANGSDECLTLLLRTFVDPGELIAYPYPSYTLYETLADLQGAAHERLLLNADWSWNTARNQPIIEKAKLVFVPNPNSPSGNRWTDEEILVLVPPNGLLVLDEAYGDFADKPHRAELLRSEKGKQIIITRTLSKSYSLAGLRMGFAMGDAELIAGMRKVKDGYNCDRLSLAGGLAAIEDQEFMQENTRRIRETRIRLQSELDRLGFDTVDSQANFVWCTHPTMTHEEIYLALKARKILVRHMKFPGAFPDKYPNKVFDGLRITVGTNEEIDHFLEHLAAIV